MAHKTGVLRTHSGLECPLASLGRTGSTVMGALNGLHQSNYHHHPLSLSPLDSQVYQISRKLPDLTTDADNIIYTTNNSLSVMTPCQVSNSVDTSLTSISLPAIQLDESSSPKLSPITGELYNLSRSSSQSSLEESLPLPPLPVERKSATFEFCTRTHNRSKFMSNKVYSGSVGKVISKQLETKLGSSSMITTTSSDSHAVAIPTSLVIQEHGGFITMTNTGLDAENSNDANNSSRSKNCIVDNSSIIPSSSSSSTFCQRHYRPICHGATSSVVPTKFNTKNNINSNDTALILSPPPPIYLEKEMNALYFGTGAMRTLSLGSDSNSTFENDIKYPSNSNLRHLSDYSKERSTCFQEPVPHLVHHRVSSPSETSGSERYILNRTNSPTNVFSSCNIDNQDSSVIIGNHSNNNAVITVITNSSTASSNNIAYLDSRCYHSKLQGVSDGLSNLGRFSPNLDQGYATLVSPSPTGHHSSSISIGTTPIGMVHNTVPLNSHLVMCSTTAVSAAAAAVARRYTESVETDGVSNRRSFVPPPWNRKGSYQAGPFFNCLPDEAIIRIFNWLQSYELCQVARVCRRFEQLAWLPMLWKIITLRGERFCGDKVLKMIFRQLCGQTRNGSCPEVERVMLADNCKISDKSLQLLTRRCPELTHLQLHGCVNITNQALEDVLTKCNNIQHLDVTGCTQITSIAPAITNIEPNRRLLLQYLDLTDCLALDDAGLKIVVKNCPQLIYLYMRRCVQISDAGLKFVPSFCIALKELSVSDCLNITDFGLYELAKLGASLRYLSVAKCDRVSDAGLKVVARRCYKLRYLNARGCEAVSDDSITVLARSCSRLRALDIGKCDVSDAGLRALAESCPNLKKISLRNCDMITDRGVQCIAYYCRGLQQLNIQDCQISIEGYRAVKKYCKRCIIEHTNPGFC